MAKLAAVAELTAQEIQARRSRILAEGEAECLQCGWIGKDEDIICLGSFRLNPVSNLYDISDEAGLCVRQCPLCQYTDNEVHERAGDRGFSYHLPNLPHQGEWLYYPSKVLLGCPGCGEQISVQCHDISIRDHELTVHIPIVHTCGKYKIERNEVIWS